MNSKPGRVVVTGALGHIGSRLIRDLPGLWPGVEIIMVDDLSTQRYCSLFDLPDGARYRFVEADVVTADLRDVVKGADALIHLAAMTNAADSFAESERVQRANVVGTERIAEVCAATGCPMISLSTTSVYGTQSGTVDAECAVSELKPQSPYAESKLRAEMVLREIAARSALRHVTCRFGTIYGTSVGMRFHTAINKFCWQAVMGQPITVWRSAMHQYRPYLHLTDAVAAIAFLIEHALFDGQTYDVVTVNTTVAHVLDAISEHIGPVAIEYVDSPIMNQLSYHVSAERFERLGFEFRGDLHLGIKETLDLLRASNAVGHIAP